MKNFKSFIKNFDLNDFEEDVIGEEMKTFKQHLKEDHAVGTPEVNSVEDGSMGAHNIHDQKVLDRVNAFVGSIAAQEYLNPKAAVEQLANKLKTIGLEVSMPAMEGANGSVTGEVSQFGGRFGKDTDTPSDEFLNDDGISHMVEGGLALKIQYEMLSNSSCRIFAEIV